MCTCVSPPAAPLEPPSHFSRLSAHGAELLCFPAAPSLAVLDTWQCLCVHTTPLFCPPSPPHPPGHLLMGPKCILLPMKMPDTHLGEKEGKGGASPRPSCFLKPDFFFNNKRLSCCIWQDLLCSTVQQREKEVRNEVPLRTWPAWVDGLPPPTGRGRPKARGPGSLSSWAEEGWLKAPHPPPDQRCSGSPSPPEEQLHLPRAT